MLESDLSGKFMPALRSRGYHATRVENAQGSGTPDINYAKLRTQGWVETKVAKGPWLYFERFQIPWMVARCKATEGRGVWVLAEIAGHAVLFSGPVIIAAPREPYRKWVRIRVDDLQGKESVAISLAYPLWDAIINAIADES